MDAEQIVRALAALRAPVSDSIPPPECTLCQAEAEGDYTNSDAYWIPDPASHKPDCPWRLAREWVTSRDQDAGPGGP